MTKTSVKSAPGTFVPLAALLASMVSIQFGATYAKTLFPIVGPQGTAALRLGFGTLILAVVMRPWRARLSWRTLPYLLAYGACLGGMNLLFFMAVSRVPLGLAVALEFTGPLALAVGLSRRWLDLGWIALAVAGVAVLLPLGHAVHGIDPLGAAYALGAGALWALYTIVGQRAGADHGSQTTALGMAIGAVLVIPVGLAHAGTALFAPALVFPAIMVAIFASAIPFPLEMVALTRLPTRVYGTLTCGEPAIGAVMGFVFLHERLTAVQSAAILAIVLASIGTAATMKPVVSAV